MRQNCLDDSNGLQPNANLTVKAKTGIFAVSRSLDTVYDVLAVEDVVGALMAAVRDLLVSILNLAK